jgi:outer membrane lipoprotein-sorting protein
VEKGTIGTTVKKLRSTLVTATMIGMATLGLYGCGGDSPTPTALAPTPTTAAVEQPTATTAAMEEPTATTAAIEEPTATTAAMEQPTATTASGGGASSGDAMGLLESASTAMRDVKSYHIVMQIQSGDQQVNVEGDMQLPDKMRLDSEASGTKSQMIVIGDSAYAQMPGSEAYIQVPFDSSILASTNSATMLSDIAEDATVVGDEQVDGADTTHVKFSYDPNKAAAAAATVTGQSAPTPDASTPRADADVWIDKSNNYIRRMKIASTVQGTASTTTITYSKFNETIDPPIEKPANVQEMPSMPNTDITPPAAP